MANKSLMEKFKEFVEGSAESNVPMTGREIAKTKAKKKARGAAVKRATASKKAKKQSLNTQGRSVRKR
jgi:hypothetical protein